MSFTCTECKEVLTEASAYHDTISCIRYLQSVRDDLLTAGKDALKALGYLERHGVVDHECNDLLRDAIAKAEGDA